LRFGFSNFPITKLPDFQSVFDLGDSSIIVYLKKKASDLKFSDKFPDAASARIPAYANC